MARDEGYGYQGSSGVGATIGGAAGSLARSLSSGGRSPAKKIASNVKRNASARVRAASSTSVRKPAGGYSSPNRSNPRSSSGGGNKGTSKPPTGNKPSSMPAKPKVPKVPDINAYLGTDSTYQDVVRGGQRSLTDFLSELGRRRGESETQFGTTKSSMERDRVQQLEDLRNEFASRGLIQSGVYGQEQGRFQEQFQQQQTALEQQQAALIADILSQETNFRREQELSLEAAKQDALQRRAAKFNIGA